MFTPWVRGETTQRGDRLLTVAVAAAYGGREGALAWQNRGSHLNKLNKLDKRQCYTAIQKITQTIFVKTIFTASANLTFLAHPS